MKQAVLLLLITLSAIFAQEKKFVKSAQSKNVVLLSKENSKNWCAVCGMNLKMFYKTNHAILLNNGTIKQYCSIRCLSTDKNNYENIIKKIMVVDAKSEKFIDAQKAFYVVGSNVPGTMSQVSKIAFEKKKDAEEFENEFNGKIMSYQSVLKLATEQLEKDNALLMKKKKMKIYPKGGKLFAKLCKKELDLHKFKSIAELKAFLNNNHQCKKMDEKQLQMIALYLWDVKRIEKKSDKKATHINVPKIEKCPVCGMFVYKNSKWAAVLEIVQNNKITKLYFDGVKDLVKFYFKPGKWGNYKNIKIKGVILTDYYNQTAIDGLLAVYVSGSDVLGPMGKEIIPFSNKENAMTFIKDHGGKLINSFGEISSKIIKMLDE